MSVNAVLFDLDGTLTDSRPGIFNTTRYAFSRLREATGRDFLPSEGDGLDWIVGPPLRDSFAKLAGAEHVEALIGFYRERYRDIGAFENQVYVGVPEALDALVARGLRLFVATSKNYSDAVRILDHFDLSGRFRAIYGARDDGGLADKTELIGHLLSSEKLAASEAAMVGDRKFDIIGARGCGAKAIGALWGYGGREELVEAGADMLVERPGDVSSAV